MGVHTWCYAELPKSADLKKKFIEGTAIGIKEMHSYWYDRTDEEWMDSLKEDIRSKKDWLECYQEADDKTECLKYFGSQEKLDAYIEICKHADEQTVDEMKRECRTIFDPAYKDFNSGMDIWEFLVKYGDCYTWGFYGIEVINGKLYASTYAHFDGDTFEENDYIFPEEQRFNDIFRIGDPNIPNCFSIEEAKAAVKKWVDENPDVDYRGGRETLLAILDGSNKCIEEFFAVHPTGFIHFG